MVEEYGVVWGAMQGELSAEERLLHDILPDFHQGMSVPRHYPKLIITADDTTVSFSCQKVATVIVFPRASNIASALGMAPLTDLGVDGAK